MLCLKMLPETLDKMEHLLRDENWCRNYFVSARWPEGFTCGRCHWDTINYMFRESNLTICPQCGHTSSITSGTLLHGTKKKISQWLMAAWIICTSLDRLSIRGLQQKLKIENYQTVRNWMKKLQSAKRMADSKTCMGFVEIEDCLLFSRKENRECHLFTALEVNVKNNVTGRLRMFHCNDLSPAALQRFLHYCVEENSTVLFPDREPYASFHSNRYLSITESPALRRGAVSHLVASFLDSQLHHPTSVFSLRRLETLCDEFCFQENKKLFPDTLAVFENLVTSIVKSPPLPADSSQAHPEKRWRDT